MITTTKGNILDSSAEAIVNTVNCVGVMGRGIALQFRKSYPKNYKHYKSVCDEGQMLPGKVLVYDLQTLTTPRYIINFPTKKHWKEKSRLKDIEQGLRSLVAEIQALKIKSIAIPPLGCGLGGLNWKEVKPLIEQTFQELQDVEVFLYEPANITVKSSQLLVAKEPKMTIGRATLLGLMRKYLAAAMDPFITLLEIHKLMYFMQESGQPLKLVYSKAPYGPYAENLRHVLTHIEGHFITGFEKAIDAHDTRIALKSERLPLAEHFLNRHPETMHRFSRVVDLIEGFETPYGMELLSTVHWVANYENAKTPEEAIQKTHNWGFDNRKRMFKETEIKIAWEKLVKNNWIDTPSIH